MNKSTPLFEIKNLTVKTLEDDRKILDGLSFSIKQGEIFSIFGESGAGKSVLSRALADWLPETLRYENGEILFQGLNILDHSGATNFRVGRDIAYIGSKPQSALDPTQPVGVQIVEKLRSVRPEWSVSECKDRVLKLLAEVRIPSPNDRYWDYPSKFSGGMMQRAMIVDAICAEPPLLIADNITQALDVTIAAQIVKILHDMCVRHNTATIYMSSSLATLGQFSGPVSILHKGRLIETQVFNDILNSPREAYTKQAISSVPKIWVEDREKSPSRSLSADPLFSVQNVHRTYRTRKRGKFNEYNLVQAVRGVSVDILKRENFGIVGESGCGKSTLTRLLAALEISDFGQISMNGVDLVGLSEDELLSRRSEFQLLLQDPYNALPPRMTVGRMIEEGLRIRGKLNRNELRSSVLSAMQDVGLSADLYDELPTNLSTGERQRISIARALVLNPKLLILDETLSSLDQQEQSKLIELFRDLQDKNDLTYVFISHDLAMVRKVCSRIAVMYLGEFVEISENHDLFFDPRHPYTKALLAAAPTLEKSPFDASTYLLEGEPPSPIDIPPGCAFASRCPKAFDRCRTVSPKITQLGVGRFVACHLEDDEHKPAT